MKEEDIIKYEREEIKRTKLSISEGIKKFVKGEFIQEDKIRYGYIIFLVLLGVIYISMKYWVDILVKEEIKLKKENRILRSKQITLSFDLIKAGQRSEVEKMLKAYDIDLKMPVDPPYIIKVKKDEQK